MDFHCFVCPETFSDIKDIFTHLKKVHFFRDNAQELECVLIRGVYSSKCVSKFNTFSGLRKHVKTCLEKRKEEERNNHDDLLLSPVIEVYEVSSLACSLKFEVDARVIIG